MLKISQAKFLQILKIALAYEDAGDHQPDKEASDHSRKLFSAIDGLTDDEKFDLIAIFWVGRRREAYRTGEFREARADAKGRIDPEGAAAYLIKAQVATHLIGGIMKICGPEAEDLEEGDKSAGGGNAASQKP